MDAPKPPPELMPLLIGWLAQEGGETADFPTKFLPYIDAAIQKTILHNDHLPQTMLLSNIRSLWMVLSKTAEGRSALVEAGITPFEL